MLCAWTSVQAPDGRVLLWLCGLSVPLLGCRKASVIQRTVRSNISGYRNRCVVCDPHNLDSSNRRYLVPRRRTVVPQSIGSDTTGDFARVRGWLVGRLNAFGRAEVKSPPSGRPAPSSCTGISQWQEGCPEIIPGTYIFAILSYFAAVYYFYGATTKYLHTARECFVWFPVFKTEPSIRVAVIMGYLIFCHSPT